MMPWEKNVRKVVPYTPGEQPKCTKLIKLNTNENPYPPSPKVAEALKGLDMGSLRRYPDPAASALVQELARYYGVSESMSASKVAHQPGYADGKRRQGQQPAQCRH